MRSSSFLIGCAVSVLSATASAQTFPPDAAWAPLPCGAVVMFDPFQDQAGFFFERDLVGDSGAAAGFRAFDASFLYLRMRLDRDPAPGATPLPSSWGFELDLDGDLDDYELLITVNGDTGRVAVYRNTVTTLPNNPADPADLPALATYPFSSHARSLVAAGSRYGNDADFFIDLAVPWSDLTPLGLTPSTPILMWAGSSSSDNALNGDLACHDPRGGGPPSFTGIPTTRTTINPAAAPDGGVPPGGGGRAFEGAPGCALGGAGAGASLLGALLALMIAGRLARRRTNEG